MKPEEMNRKGVEQTMIAIYAQASNDLISAIRSNNASKVQYLEEWFRADPYGFITDEDGVLRAIRIKAETTNGWVRCPEFVIREERENEDYTEKVID